MPHPAFTPPPANAARIIASIALLIVCHTATAAAALPRLEETFQSAYARTDGTILTVGTGGVERRWKWTGHGLVTIGFDNTLSGRKWANRTPAVAADWGAPGWIDPTAKARLISLTAAQDDDEGFTASHLRVNAEIAYPETNIIVRYIIWAYPGAPGLRTQLWVKGAHPASAAMSGKIDFVPVRGTRSNAGPAASGAPPQLASVLRGNQQVIMRAEGLKAGVDYVMGLSWCDFDGKAGRQSVELASVDGEATVEVVSPRSVPRHAGSNTNSIELFDVPTGVNMDGTVTVRIRQQGGAHAQVSEIWLYQKGTVEPRSDLPIAPGRRAGIEKLAPEGATLVGYFDCGDPKSDPRARPQTLAEERRSDYLPIAARDATLRAIGYYNDTQHRNDPGTPIIREEIVTPPTVDWASVVSLEDKTGGVMMVKESHKCVNQAGVDTGIFGINEDGMVNTGWSFGPREARADEFLWCWATWTIAFNGGADERELALKQFDRLRFPAKAARDMWMVACTWGHSKGPRDGRNYAHEKEVLPEMKSVADLGIDMLLIDDGWQVSSTAREANPTGPEPWKPDTEVYPEGWKNVADLKQQLGVRLGLWGIAQGITTDAMVWNWKQIGMEQFKLDFARLQDHRSLDEMMHKARTFMLRTNQSCIISWDVTENAPRYGYYWAREYGNVHFMNRKPYLPANVVYIPWLALRDFWILSKYNNLNKWQLVTNIPSNVNRDMSDAHRHSVSYCTATTFMGIPEFMATTRYYTPEERSELKPLIAQYKTVRREIFDRIVFPIGSEPTNASWTGFQAHDPEKGDGCLLILREIDNRQPQASIALRFLAGTKIAVTNVRTNATAERSIGADGRLEFTIENPADFLLLRYSPVGGRH